MPDFTADQKVVRYVLTKFRSDASSTTEKHLATCDGVTVTDLDGDDVGYGCDTGCDYVEFVAVIECPHGHKTSYTYGDFGDLSMILDEIAAMDAAEDEHTKPT